MKSEGEAADNIVGGPEHSTLSNDAFPSREFDFMLSNPTYGKSWKTDLERMGGILNGSPARGRPVKTLGTIGPTESQGTCVDTSTSTACCSIRQTPLACSAVMPTAV